MNKVRFFTLITFSDNNILIDYLSLISEKLGKYDFFTQNIRYPCDLSGNFISGSNYKIKVISLKKIYSIDKCGYFLKKCEEIKKKIGKSGYADFKLVCGYLNKHHVVTLDCLPAPERIYMSRNLYAQIQLVLLNNRMAGTKMENMEFSVSDVKKYFEDLYSIYREQISKSSP